MTTAVSCHYWVRVNLSIEICVKDAAIDVAYNTHNDPSCTGLPSNKQALYQLLLTRYNDKNHSLHRVFKPNQWNALLPPSGQTDLRECDLTQIISIVQSEKVVKPLGGWGIKSLQAGDNSLGAFMYLTRQLRNELKHGTTKQIETQGQFTSYWNRIENILKGLKYRNMKRFYDLENEILDPYMKTIETMIKTHIANIEQELDTFKKTTSSNFASLQSNIDILECDTQNRFTRLEKDFEDMKIDNEDKDEETRKRMVIMENDISLLKKTMDALQKKPGMNFPYFHLTNGKQKLF